MSRILFVVLLMVLVVHPAWAGQQERANKLFVESVKLIQAALDEQDVEVRHGQLIEAQENFQRIIEDYPSSDVATKLISGQSIGQYSLESVRDVVDRAYNEVLAKQLRIAAKKAEEQSIIAAKTAENLLSQMAETRMYEDGEPLAQEFRTLMAQLQLDYGKTNHLRDLYVRFSGQYSILLNTWARTAAEPIELLLTKLEPAQSVEEGEPLIEIIDKELLELSQFYGQVNSLISINRRFSNVKSVLRNTWALTAAEPIERLFTRLKAARSSEEGEPLIEAIDIILSELSQKYGQVKSLNSINRRFSNVKSYLPNKWAKSQAQEIYDLIDELKAAGSAEKGAPLISAIKKKLFQLSNNKYGSKRTFNRVRLIFQDELQRLPNTWIVLEFQSVEIIIATFSKSKSIRGATKIVDAINQLDVKYGWSRQLADLRSQFKRALRKTEYQKNILNKLK